MADQLFPDPANEFAVQNQQLERRRALAQQLVRQGMQGNTGGGYQGGRVFMVGSPIGNVAAGLAGQYVDSQAADAEQTLVGQRQAVQKQFTDQYAAATTPAEKQAALVGARDAGVRNDLEKAFYELDAKQNEAESARQLKAAEVASEKEANRQFLEGQKALDRENRIELRQMPTTHVTVSGGGTGPRDRFSVQQGPDGKMYRVNMETGVAAPITVEGGSPLIKPNPAERKTAIAQDEIISKVDAALKALEANPDAVGLKTLVPDIALQRADPTGVGVRAALGELGAEKTHELYGAAFSASEQKRANSFIPASGDSKATIATKLKNLKALAEQARARAMGAAKPAAPASGGWDAGKEQRYQEWKAQNGK